VKIAVFGLSITSSWGNAQASNYRGLLWEMAKRGHEVLFFERVTPWYAENRDLPAPSFCHTRFYSALGTLFAEHGLEICGADCVIVGSNLCQGIEVGRWVSQNTRGIKVFYDMDTPATLAALAQGSCKYLSCDLIPRFDLYLTCSGGQAIEEIEQRYGSPAARPLYCSVDPQVHYPLQRRPRWDLGYLGTYCSDRQPGLQSLLCEPAVSWNKGRFAVAGPQYPPEISWPHNTKRIEHVPVNGHRDFYYSQRFTLNLTRRTGQLAGYSPCVRLFEAAACGVPIISDRWSGLEEFFIPGKEILISEHSSDVLRILHYFPEEERRAMGELARKRVLKSHSAARRAEELESYLISVC
jgi:spore maturation protein CgeB